MRKTSAIILVLAILAGLFSAGAFAEGEYRLEQVTILSRHNIRSPLSAKGSLVSDITPHEWFAWTSNTGELSLRGAMLETTMGQYFRLWLEKEGLIPENYIPEDGAVRFYANGLQRTQATAHYFSTGLLPVAVVPVERRGEYGEADDTFLPIIRFMTDEYAADIQAEIGEMMSAGRAGMEKSLEVLKTVTDMEETEAYQTGKYGNLEEDESAVTLAEGVEPRMSGPLKAMCSIADSLVLQYYEESDPVKAAFGHEMSEEDWRAVGSVLAVYQDILFTSDLLAANLCHPMLEELLREMNTEGRKFSFLCGHDATIASVLAALDAEPYELPGAIEPTTPIGAKLVFERWADAEGKDWYRIDLVYQSTEQLRSIQPLSLDDPPMIVPLSFAGIQTNADGMAAGEDLMNLFAEKIRMLEEIEEEYAEEAGQEAA